MIKDRAIKFVRLFFCFKAVLSSIQNCKDSLLLRCIKTDLLPTFKLLYKKHKTER